MKRILMAAIVLFAVGFLSACSTDGTFTNDKKDSPQEEIKEEVEEEVEEEIEERLLQLTVEQLVMYNGEDGNPAYIAVNGVIYNVTDVSAWSGGSHNGGVAGTDVSNLIGNAPHGESVLEDLVIVGEIVE